MDPILMHAIIWGTVIVIASILYMRSDLSRKQYACPHCGERIAVELMEAKNCPSCGADLKREA